MAKRHGKNGRAVIGAGDGTNEVQTITPPGSATYTITYDGQTTDALAFGASTGAVQAALEALSNIGSGNVSVTGSGTRIVEFTGFLAATNVSAMTVSAGSIAQTTAGSAGTVLGVAVTKWEANHEMGTEESNTTESLGYEDTEDGVEKCDWTLEGFWDSNHNPYKATAPSFYPGQRIYLKLQLGRASSDPAFVLPTAKVVSAKITSAVNGLITWSVSGKCGGKFSKPTG